MAAMTQVGHHCSVCSRECIIRDEGRGVEGENQIKMIGIAHGGGSFGMGGCIQAVATFYLISSINTKTAEQVSGAVQITG